MAITLPGITALDKDSASLSFPLIRESLFVLNQCKNFPTYIMEEKTINQINTSQFLPPGWSCQLELPAFLLVFLSLQDPLDLCEPKTIEQLQPNMWQIQQLWGSCPAMALQDKNCVGVAGARQCGQQPPMHSWT